jgi:predicted nucleic acid-binding protein
MPTILVDTNVWIYFYDQNSPEKQERSRLVLDRLHDLENSSLSVQILAEFISTAMRKLDPPLSASQAYEQASMLSSSWIVLDLTPQIVLEAARGVRDHGLAYYDSQVWATARLNQIPLIFSEDFQNGQILESVRFVNPYTTNFDIEDWI